MAYAQSFNIDISYGGFTSYSQTYSQEGSTYFEYDYLNGDYTLIASANDNSPLIDTRGILLTNTSGVIKFGVNQHADCGCIVPVGEFIYFYYAQYDTLNQRWDECCIGVVGGGGHNMGGIQSFQDSIIVFGFETTVICPGSPWMVTCDSVIPSSPANDGQALLILQGGNPPYHVMVPGQGVIDYRSAGAYWISGLAPGPITFTINDDIPAVCYEQCTAMIPACTLAVNYTVEPILCNSGSGSILINTSGGSEPYSFQWSGPISIGNTPNPTNLPAGDYSVTVSDQLGCTQIETILLSEPPPLTSFCSTMSNVSTVGGSDGVGKVELSGGTAPYQVAWSGPVSGTRSLLPPGMIEVNQLLPGDYQIVVTDANNCESRCTFYIDSVQCDLDAAITKIDPLCWGASNGEIQVMVQNGVDPIRFDWSSPGLGKTSIVEGLTAGNYGVTITDARLCMEARSAVLVDPPNLIFSCQLASPIATFGGDEAAVLLQLEGGLSPYTYSWNGPQSGSQQSGGSEVYVSDLSAGIYTLEVIDANGCVKSCEIDIPEYECHLSFETNLNPPSCPGDGNGRIEVVPSGGVPPYTVSWSGNSGTSYGTTIDGLVAGIYSLRIIDAHNCSLDTSILLNDPPHLISECTVLSNVLTKNGDEGKISVNLEGGTPPFQISWRGAENGFRNSSDLTHQLSKLRSGDYFINIQDAQGCETGCSVYIDSITCNLGTTEVSIHPQCLNTLDGSIEIQASGNIGPVRYIWSGLENLPNSPHLDSLPPGTYTVMAIDNALCAVQKTIELKAQTDFQIRCDILQNQVTKNGLEGTVLLSISNQNPTQLPYQIEIRGTESKIIQILDSVVVIDSLKPGLYEVEVSQLNGCSQRCEWSIQSVECILSAEIQSQSPSCADKMDGHIKVNMLGVQGDVSYNWSQGDSTWQGTNILDGLGEGEYTLAANDQSGCGIQETIRLSSPDSLVLKENIEDTQEGIAQGKIKLFVEEGTPPYQIHWNNGDTLSQINHLEPGAYSVTVTDSKGCQAIKTYQVNEILVPCMSFDVQIIVVSESCPNAKDGLIGLSPVGGVAPYSVLWSNAATTTQIVALSEGQYNVEIKDATGCSIVRMITVGRQNQSLVSKQDLKLCDGDTLTINDRIITGPGIFRDTLSSELGCDSILIYDVSIEPRPKIITRVEMPDPCNEYGMIEMSAPVGSEMSLDQGVSWTPVQSLSKLLPDTYTIWIRNQEGNCVYPLSPIELIPLNIEMEWTKQDPVLCENYEGQIIGVGINPDGLEYSLDNVNWQNQPVFTELRSGAYPIRVKYPSGCVILMDTIILSGPSVSLSLMVDTIMQPICGIDSSGRAVLQVNGGNPPFSIGWSHGEKGPVADFIPAGDYFINVEDSLYCRDSLSISLTDNTLSIPVISNPQYLCEGGFIRIAQPSNWVYQWDDVASLTIDDSTVFISATGSYPFSASNNQGCMHFDTLTVLPLEEFFLVSFLIPSAAVQGIEFVAIENSWPVPDSIKWHLDTSAFEIVSTHLNQLTLNPKQLGKFEIQLTAFKGACSQILTKEVTIASDSTENVGGAHLTSDIRSLSINPNPNRGNFRVNVSLSKVQPIQLRIYNPYGMVIRSDKEQVIESDFEKTYDLSGSEPGIYTLVLYTESDVKLTSFVLVR